MKRMREFSIAMVLVGLVAVNFFYLLDIFFRGVGSALFPREAGVLIDWKSVIAIIVANIVALVGLFYLVRPQPDVATASGLTQEGPAAGIATEERSTEGGLTEGVSTEDRPSESRPTEGGPTER